MLMPFRNVPCSIPALFSPADVLEFRKLTVSIRVAPAIKKYAVDLVRATRDPAAYGLGLAPPARARRQSPGHYRPDPRRPWPRPTGPS